jgi:hypothetical protein
MQSTATATVRVVIVSLDNKGGLLITQTFEGTWDLIVDGSWKLDTSRISLVN